MNKEIWRKIPDIPSNYEISNMGNARKEIIGGGYELLSRSTSDGYYTVCFEGKQFKIHRLVAIAFLPNSNPKKYTLVKFKDGNKKNPVADNLEWCTKSETNESKYKLGMNSEKLVLCTDTNQIFSTCVTAAAYYGLPKDAVSSAVKNGHPCFGKHFRYVASHEIEDCDDVLYISTRQLVELSKTMKDASELIHYFH